MSKDYAQKIVDDAHKKVLKNKADAKKILEDMDKDPSLMDKIKGVFK